MADDYYELLELQQNATQEEIQKAYRKLARKYHPDLHADESDREKDQAKKRFQQIQRAYDVLNDPEKRELYDRFGANFDNPGAGPGRAPFEGGNPFGSADIDFSQIFGGPGPQPGGKPPRGFGDFFRHFGGMGGEPRPPQAEKGPDVEQQITISFYNSIAGGEHQVSLQRRNGKVDTIKVKIPAGVEDRKKIRLRGLGETGAPGNTRGDLLLTVRVASHPNYSRSGMNLKVTVPITLQEAIFGAKIDLPTPGGIVSVTVPKGTTTGKTLRLKGLGIKSKDRVGDLLVQPQIQVPDNISAADAELIRRLGPRWNDPKIRDGLHW